MGLLITSDMLKHLNMSSQDFLIEMAVHFYDIGKMTMGQAQKFTNIDQITLQKELAKRNVNIKYEVEDFMVDREAVKSYIGGNLKILNCGIRWNTSQEKNGITKGNSGLTILPDFHSASLDLINLT